MESYPVGRKTKNLIKAKKSISLNKGEYENEKKNKRCQRARKELSKWD